MVQILLPLIEGLYLFWIRKVLFAFIAALATNVIAEEETASWGLGLGLAAGIYPHYPGSDQNDNLFIPFFYPEYYGENIRLDTDGLAANLFDSDRVNLDFSLNGSLPVSDEDNQVRQGMGDLELIVEIGPAAEITLLEWENAEFRFDLPLRAAFEVTLEKMPRDAGLTFDPRLHYERNFGAWNWDMDVGALLATERYHALYYNVPDVFATTERPAYRADDGLTGWRVSSSAERRVGDWIFYAYLRYLNFSGAANDDSPLLVEDDYVAGGVALIWMFKTSKDEN